MTTARLLTVAREARGLSQKQLADLVGVSQGAVSKAETELRPFPSEHIERLAQVLGVTPALLCWTDPVFGFGSASFFHRKQQSLPQKHLRMIHAEVNLLRMRLRRLTAEISIDHDLTVPRLDVDEIGSPAEVARRLRAAWRIPLGPVRDLVQLVEAAGGIVLRRDFRTHRINALSMWHPDLGRPMFLLNKDLPADNQRFVLAHELGHMIMHEGHPPPDTAEREADAFAEELLLPAHEVARPLAGLDLKTAARLKPYWKVSMQSLILRAEHLEQIPRTRSRSLHAYMNKKGYLPNEPQMFERELPQVVTEMFEVHRREHDYTLDELVAVMGMASVDQLVTEFGLPEERNLRVVR